MQHQLDCWLRQKDLVAAGIAAEMGTGKGLMLITQSAYLYDSGRINALALVAPKGGYSVWPDDVIPNDLPDHIRFKLGVWTASPRKAEQEALDALFRGGDEDFHILVMNVEALNTERGRKLLEKFLLSHHAMLAVDESTCIKSESAARTKALVKLGRRAKYRRALSGEPAPDSPMDWYSQNDFLEEGLLGFDSFYTFKAHFAKLVPMKVRTGRTDKQGHPILRAFSKIDGFRNEDELRGLIARHWFIVKKEDCLDLPPKVYANRMVEMGPEQRRAYDQMLEECQVALAGEFRLRPDATFEDATAALEGTAGETMTAKLVITQLLRLHQILCGFMVLDDGTVKRFDEPNPRMEELMSVLEQTRGKVIIWATYKLSVKDIAARITEQYGPASVVTFFGETSQDDRREAVRRFQDPADPCRFCVANDTMARAVTMTQGKTAIYYSVSYNADTHNQSQDREHRIGSEKVINENTGDASVLYLYFQVPGTADQKIIQALKEKKRLSDLITASNWRSFLA